MLFSEFLENQKNLTFKLGAQIVRLPSSSINPSFFLSSDSTQFCEEVMLSTGNLRIRPQHANAALQPFRNGRWFSSRWKQQRDSDIYAERAINEGMRSRAAYKLEEINKRFELFLRPGANVIDLGAAPGGFSSVTAKNIRLDDVIDRWNSASRVNSDRVITDTKRTLGGTQVNRKYGQLICVDRDYMEPIAGAVFIKGDLRDEETHERIRQALYSNEADVILSDMAPDTTGEKETNHIRIMALAEEAFNLSLRFLRNGGSFVCKVFSGAEEMEFKRSLQKHFSKVRAFRPAASRKVSPEIYYVALGFVPDHMRMKTYNEHSSLYEQVDEDIENRKEKQLGVK